MELQQTLIILKPDAVQRGCIGEIVTRLERAGLKMVAIKMVHPAKDDLDRHYALTEEWMRGVYEKAKGKYEAEGKDFPFADHIAYGTQIKNGLMEYMLSAPVVIMVWEGDQSVAIVRKLVGATEPAGALPGTIRGDLSHDNYPLANAQNRPLRNLIHASGTAEEAKNEIAIWFTDVELHQYEHVNDRVQYDPSWFLPKTE